MSPSSSARLADLVELVDRLGELIAMDGGSLELLSADPVTGRVHLLLSGACQSCALSSTTMLNGVERALRQRLDWVTELSYELDDIEPVAGYGAYVPKRNY